MELFKDFPSVRIQGHVKIFEYENRSKLGTDTGRVVLDKTNAIHKENASILIARAIANRENGSIYTMHFGTGGATIDTTGAVLFSSPNVTGAADLNIPVYSEVVDDSQNAPSGNYMSVRHVNGTLFSDVEIRCVMDRDEPYGQPALSNASGIDLNTNGFSFDEIGLKMGDGLLISHLIFTPILKASDRVFEAVYVLRIRIV